MDSKDQIDACIKLANFGAGRWDARKQYEWKLTVATWAVLVASIVYFKVAALPIWIGAIGLLLYGSWLQGAWLRHASDAEFTWLFINEAQRIVSAFGVATTEPKSHLRVGRGRSPKWFRGTFGLLTDWSMRFQFLVTLGLTVLAYHVCAERITWFEFAK